ncbi:Protein CBG17827 [Caenorhabditis briggsae]|uniref:Peptidase C1A papain C-terminal domain-containing protein n=2 Tax=Caenorhabditis briggsae TaxID=6238 RepID=A0AAE9AAY7_CAEBR|nr:Protein CBG17827 [Caenorhabditis briggsae]ULT92310.1 hypothetical protein L3Y34_009817 [Caenorhabditis briggsae]CAP35379.1 Protein CBG17827 [Caenorhabditis briggsae]
MIRNQTNCGSCWAFGAAEVISDRICIVTKGARQPIISPTDMLDCCGEYCGYGCDGCPKAVTPKCALSCQSKYNTEYAKDKNFGSSAYYVGRNFSVIQTEIMTNGPVEASFTVYEDFYIYKKGVYQYTAGEVLGGHAIKIIGWGTENGTDY